MCRVAVPLQYCRVEIPGLQTFNLNRGISNSYVSYYGEGLDAGQCGFTLHGVKDQNNGEIKCTLGIISEAQESIGTMSLIVANAPKPPELELSRGTDQLNVYKVDDTLEASCTVRDGRPVANITWFLDDEPIDELPMPAILELAKEHLLTKVQNLTRKLRASDNGKFLRCVAYHPAYPGQVGESKRRLDIKYAPLPQRQTIEAYDYGIGKTGEINVTVEANPRPSFEWTVDGQRIREGSHDNTGIMEAEFARELGNGRYLAVLRIARIGKQDTEKVYILKAYNDQGSQEYRVKISTNSEPKGITKFFKQHVYGVYGYEFGADSIIAIVVAILFIILVISILIFAKITGRWCFSGQRDSRYIAESDTESADVRPKEKKCRLPSIQLTSAFFRKKFDKSVPEQRDNQDQDEADADTIPAEELTNTDQVLTTVEKVNEKEVKDKNLVYAELDLVSPNSPNLKPVVKGNDDKTEYAEIVYTPSKEDEKEGKEEKNKK
ncbi:fasciclin-3 isoform X2 [Sitophilus oryzae]|uniref:Fasciclin-3 isoform X2 n=1 Tax=Sitophilus oryzae TaxID=7048 RepID=A0A6J2X9G2_SITOR|nr:fasciclin-3 isoform X2 [Sitophilus oryzae]